MSKEKPSVDDPDYPLYTVAQATELLGVNPPTLRRWEREGLVSPQRTDGRQRRYTRRELRQLDQAAQLANEGVTTAGIRKIFELQDRIDQLENQLATRKASEQQTGEQPGETPQA